MIIHRLLVRYFRHRDDEVFYCLQAQDSIRWLQKNGIILDSDTKVLDLGCGHGIFGRELVKLGCHVSFADQSNYLFPNLKSAPFLQIDIDHEDLKKLGQYDLVICSNVFEHLSQPGKFVTEVGRLLNTNGKLYLSWTNWLSPFGGHDFALFHYFGPRFGRWLKFKLTGKWSGHVPNDNLFLTYIGRTLEMIRRNPALDVRKMAARYYPEFSFILWIPILREFLAWNCALLIAKADSKTHDAKDAST